MVSGGQITITERKPKLNIRQGGVTVNVTRPVVTLIITKGA